MRRFLIVTSGALAVTVIVALAMAVAALASSSSRPLATTTKKTNETYRAGLSAGAEVPKPTGTKSGAAGSFKLSLIEANDTYSIAWTLTFKNLTGKAIAAHIHKGKAGKAGPVLIALCGPCRSGQKGKARVSKSVSSAIENGSAYVNVHTSKNAAARSAARSSTQADGR